jgi:hypothetical protein
MSDAKTAAEGRLRRSALLAGVAEGVIATALPLLAAAVTRDPLAVAGVVAAQHAPWIVVAFGWRRVTRTDRRTVVGLVDTIRALTVGYLGFATLAGRETILKIQLVALVVGLGEALAGSVEDEADDSRLSTRGMLGLGLVGMPLGGFLYEIFVAVPFTIDVLFFALAALFALFVRQPVDPPPAVGTAAGRLRLAKGTGPVAVTALVATAARSAVLGILVLFALVDLGLGAPAFGLLLAGLAAATAAGAWVAPEAGAALGIRGGFATAAVLSAGALVTASQVADPERPILAAIALGVAWATATTGGVLLRALLPITAGRPVTDGALRAFHLAEWLGVCGGALAGGWVAREQGVADAVQLAAIAWAVAAIAVTTARRAASPASVDISSSKLLDAA